MDIRELLLHIRQQPSDRGVQRMTGMHRKTVKRYRVWAAEQDLLTGPLPALGELEKLVQQTMPESPPPPESVVPGTLWPVGQPAAQAGGGDDRHPAAAAGTGLWGQLFVLAPFRQSAGTQDAGGLRAGGVPTGRGSPD